MSRFRHEITPGGTGRPSYSRWSIGLLGAGVFFAGIVMGFWGSRLMSRRPYSESSLRAGGYTYINPLLASDEGAGREISRFTSLENKIAHVVQPSLDSGDLASASYYFRDMKNGHWAGINEGDVYDPASLLKVPVMIAYYKEAESDPTVLSGLVQYNGGPSDEFKTLTPGSSYSVSDLLKKMIVDSDNGAKDLLLTAVNRDFLNEVFGDLDIPIPKNLSDNYEISVKQYALFFRVLYNATYLNRTYSEEALSLLAKSSFKDGIVAGVPENTVVAHKFGQFRSGTGPWEFHDCGMIYAGDPYVLCVMTRGKDLRALEKTVAAISQATFAEVKADTKNH